ncbi:MAG: amidohydrolase family protein [Nostoc sp.]
MHRRAPLSLFLGILTSYSCFIFSVVAQVPSNSQHSSTRSEAEAASWLEAHRSQPGALRAFVQRMPKGGDIHSHLSGAVYAEHYLEWAATDGYCVNPKMGTLVEPKACGQDSNYFPASELLNRISVYDSLINRWSTRNLQFAGKSGHDQFFEAFSGFGSISDSMSRRDDMVASVANRAASQHITYLELMLTVQGSEVRQLGREVGWNKDLQEMHRQLLKRGLTKLVTLGSQQFAQLEGEVSKTLGCGTPSAQASRIGHGVDILFEERPFELMEQMRRLGVLVEICLTSNEVILNVQGDQHPFREYWKAGVPMTLASDDEGISRIDLSHEYLLATTRYGLGYKDLKRLARNSLEYSFAPGNSLWKSPEFKAMVAACASDTPGKTSISQGCSAFLQKSDRARIQWQLESEFARFESLQNWL